MNPATDVYLDGGSIAAEIYPSCVSLVYLRVEDLGTSGGPGIVSTTKPPGDYYVITIDRRNPDLTKHTAECKFLTMPEE